MTQPEFYRINTPSVVHETIEGEVVAVNLEEGTYYSLRGTGADVWSLLGRISVADIVTEMAQRYSADKSQIEQGVRKVLAAMVHQGLIVQGPEPESLEPLPAASPHGQQPFDVPSLEIYTDMQDLLLLDPIHDVDETGWPSMAEPVDEGRGAPADPV